jgi:alpha-glucosidase
LAIDYSHDASVYDTRYQNQFLFGDAFLVAPVESDKLSAEVYLPRGHWYRLSSEEKFKGNKRIKVAAPLTDLPVFVKEGSIIPMQSVIQNTSEKGDGILRMHMWCGEQATQFTYYEDDGLSYDYQKGDFYKRSIFFNPNKREIILDEPEGSFNSRFKEINFFLHGFDRNLKKIRINEKTLNLTMKNKMVQCSFANSPGSVVIRY